MKFVSTAIAAACFFKLALAQVSGQPTCYFANGTALPKNPTYLEYQACPGSSICCGLNRSNPANGDPANGFTRDECLPNGLCQNRETVNGVGKTSYWVDFCTNSDVTAPGCLDVCQQTKNVVGNTPMTPCDDASSTPASTGAADSSTQSSSKLSGGAIAGIVIGALAGIALLGAAIFFARRAAMWKKKASAASETGAVPPYTQPTDGYGAAGGYDAPVHDKTVQYAHHSEIDGGTAVQELPAETMGGELPTDAPKRK
ncbi:hypothetical protein E8E13_007679 [Curvularia kusanoi]|uniref:Uncharacterized protein n=1 Tax=Curvularia kusanoi TaxID=90978 RepID=A0A9P4TCU2_CURKU|nr:hypothetical protein E8E13_007679 [Curvularia kusanoi]